MMIERTLEMLSEFHTIRIQPERNLDVSIVSVKDPDFFKLTKSPYEINKWYLEAIQKFLNQTGNHFDTDAVIDNEKANYRITKSSLERLLPGKWLNDEIINGYVSLINEREKEQNLGNVYIFNTYFYTMIEGMLKRGDYDYKKLERILTRKKINLRNYKTVVVPINIEKYHWLMLCADLVEDKFYVIDSMKAS